MIAETEKPSDMTSATAGPAATVVVVDDEVVVVVGAKIRGAISLTRH